MSAQHDHNSSDRSSRSRVVADDSRDLYSQLAAQRLSSPGSDDRQYRALVLGYDIAIDPQTRLVRLS